MSKKPRDKMRGGCGLNLVKDGVWRFTDLHTILTKHKNVFDNDMKFKL